MSKPLPRATLRVNMLAFPGRRIVSAISGLVSEFCLCLIDDRDVVSRFHIAAQELAENLLKYSSGAEASLSAELSGNDGSAVLRLQATNHATPEQLHAVERHLQELTTALDPIEHYDRLIRETAPLEKGSGLGLARIRAEGGLNVGYSINGDQITISVDSSV
jgi:hypothetical protein